MEVSRTTHALTFNTGVSNAEWTSGVVGQTPGQTQQALLPGSTTVTAALDEVFPEARTAANDIFAALVAGTGPALRTASGFNFAARKALTVDITDAQSVSSAATSPLEQVEAHDMQLLIDMVVDSMPPQRQTVYRMSREEGLTNDEIAERLGLQKKTVENHLNLALGEIRRMLKILILLLLCWG